MDPRKLNIHTSLEGINFVLLKFEFTNAERIPSGIPLLVRTEKQLAVLAQKRQREMEQQKLKNPRGYSGHQWMKDIQMVTPELLHISLMGEGFEPDKVEYTVRMPEAKATNKTPKHVVLLRYVRTAHMGSKEYEKPESEQEITAQNGEAVLKLLATTWGFTHAFNNLRAGNDVVSLSFLHIKMPADRKAALVASDGLILCMLPSGAEQIAGFTLCDPKLYADEAKKPEKRENVPSPKQEPMANLGRAFEKV